jgi:hypothetical protein
MLTISLDIPKLTFKALIKPYNGRNYEADPQQARR